MKKKQVILPRFGKKKILKLRQLFAGLVKPK
jgi:hypothetical protein